MMNDKENKIESEELKVELTDEEVVGISGGRNTQLDLPLFKKPLSNGFEDQMHTTWTV